MQQRIHLHQDRQQAPGQQQQQQQHPEEDIKPLVAVSAAMVGGQGDSFIVDPALLPIPGEVGSRTSSGDPLVGSFEHVGSRTSSGGNADALFMGAPLASEGFDLGFDAQQRRLSQMQISDGDFGAPQESGPPFLAQREWSAEWQGAAVPAPSIVPQ
jgi:hypothetical protein